MGCHGDFLSYNWYLTCEMSYMFLMQRTVDLSCTRFITFHAHFFTIATTKNKLYNVDSKINTGNNKECIA